MNADATEYVFHLRKGVKFHDDPCFPGNKGRMANASPTVGCKFVISQWISYLSNHAYNDVNSNQIANALSSENSKKELVAILDAELAVNQNYLDSIPTSENIGNKRHAKTAN